MQFYLKRSSFKIDVTQDEIIESASLSENLKNYILENISNPNLSAAHLSEVFAMSERSFYRNVERDSGMTPAAFVKEVRLQYAARLVESGRDIRLNELANKVGYKSVDTFKQNYISRFGSTPNQ
jgi:AraC-like DNA-binding protein